MFLQLVEWMDEDYSKLARAMVRFPAGTSLRWEKIGQHLNHRASEVVKRAKEMKTSNFTHIPDTNTADLGMVLMQR